VKPTRAKKDSFSSVFDSGFEPGAGEMPFVNKVWTHDGYQDSCPTSKGQISKLADGKSRDGKVAPETHGYQ
jgi:hypothetical protein